MAGLLAVASGCPGDSGDDSGDDAAGSSGTLGSGSGSGGTTAGSTESTAEDTTRGSTSTGESSTSTGTETAGGMCPDPEPPASEEPILEVRVAVHNDTEQSYYMVDEADMCDAYGLHDGRDDLGLQDPWHCGCECPAPPPPSATLTELAPGQTHEVRWDGRALASYLIYSYCEFDDDCFAEDAGVPQRVPPGTLTMTLPVYDAPEYPWPEEGTGIVQRCESPLLLELEFELATEDLQIDVDLSTMMPS